MLEDLQIFEPPYGEAVANLVLIFVRQEIHLLSESRLEKVNAECSVTPSSSAGRTSAHR